MDWFRSTFTSDSKYVYNTLESLSPMKISPEDIVFNIDKVNPDIWEKSSYNDSDAIDIMGKNNFMAMNFGIRYSNRPPTERLELWKKKQGKKESEKLIRSMPSTKMFLDPGTSDRELTKRLEKLKSGGKKKTNKKYRKNSKKRGKSNKKRKGKSIKKRGKSIKKRHMVATMY